MGLLLLPECAGSLETPPLVFPQNLPFTKWQGPIQMSLIAFSPNVYITHESNIDNRNVGNTSNVHGKEVSHLSTAETIFFNKDT